ncbi:hypothetical protein AB7M63_008281 [Bradyrhizobium japonicum]
MKQHIFEELATSSTDWNAPVVMGHMAVGGFVVASDEASCVTGSILLVAGQFTR